MATQKMLPASTDLAARLSGPMPEFEYPLPGLRLGSVGALISPGGVGKSFWTLGVAVAMAGGPEADLTGLAPLHGRVVLFSAEDSEDEVVKRLHAVLMNLPVKPDLSLFDYRDCVGLDVNVMDKAWLEAMIDAGKGAKLVVLDTLSRFHHLDENSSQEMKQLMATLEKLAAGTGASVLYLHHTSKAAVLGGLGGAAQAGRGSSVLTDNARWAAFLAVMTESEARAYGIAPAERNDYVRWNISKQNYGEAMPDRWYRRGQGGALLPVVLQAKYRADGAERDTAIPGISLQPGVNPVESILGKDAGNGPVIETTQVVVNTRSQQVQQQEAPPSATGAFGGRW